VSPYPDTARQTGGPPAGRPGRRIAAGYRVVGVAATVIAARALLPALATTAGA
jgi:hypothetical protein